jgi:G:T-mismatch repair DNA endonuclease (very short patch repair protein)
MAEIYIKKAKIKHGEKYDYSLIEYINSQTKIKIICSKHGEFLQNANSHLQGRGCVKCSLNKKNKTTENFIERANKIHNNTYNYSKVDYIKAKTKVCIICNVHGDFLQTPDNHLHNHGCDACADIIRTQSIGYSKSQIEWLKYCEIIHNTKIQHAENGGEYMIGKLRVDGFCQETNTIYEYYGDYWHGNPKIVQKTKINGTKNIPYDELYQKTMKREEKLKKLGYNLVIIWEYDWKHKLKILKQIKNNLQNTL